MSFELLCADTTFGPVVCHRAGTAAGDGCIAVVVYTVPSYGLWHAAKSQQKTSLVGVDNGPANPYHNE